MKITPTRFEGLYILVPPAFEDDRGFFMEAYNDRTFEKLGLGTKFVQDNQSWSKKNVIRGLHFQKAPYAQTKLVRVLQGRILDVVVDLRSAQPTYKKAFTIELDAASRTQLFIPKGFAHGFLVLTDQAEVLYKSDDFYNPAAEAGVNFNDPDWQIDWGIPADKAIVSSKDKILPPGKDLPVLF